LDENKYIVFANPAKPSLFDFQLVVASVLHSHASPIIVRHLMRAQKIVVIYSNPT
jgi:hypothetical protein